MSIALRDALARLTVPELKDLVSHLPGAETAGRKDQLIERIVVTILGPGLTAIWSGLDATQQAAVAEAVHDALGEYSEQRFHAKYQRVPLFEVPGAKSRGYSRSKRSALDCSSTMCATSVAISSRPTCSLAWKRSCRSPLR